MGSEMCIRDRCNGAVGDRERRVRVGFQDRKYDDSLPKERIVITEEDGIEKGEEVTFWILTMRDLLLRKPCSREGTLPRRPSSKSFCTM